MSVKFIENVFTPHEIKAIFDNIFSNENQSKWSVNKHFWEPGISDKSLGTVSIFRIHDSFISDVLEKYLEPGEKIDYIQYYEWNQLSQINWHSDTHKKGAITIYLNEYWDPNWGGFFCWQENPDKAHLIVPQFNTAVIVRDNPPHHVSLISPFAPVRKTLQIWIVPST